MIKLVGYLTPYKSGTRICKTYQSRSGTFCHTRIFIFFFATFMAFHVAVFQLFIHFSVAPCNPIDIVLNISEDTYLIDTHQLARASSSHSCHIINGSISAKSTPLTMWQLPSSTLSTPVYRYVSHWWKNGANSYKFPDTPVVSCSRWYTPTAGPFTSK